MTEQEFEAIKNNTIPSHWSRAKGVIKEKLPPDMKAAIADLKSLKGPWSEENLARLKRLIDKLDGRKPAPEEQAVLAEEARTAKAIADFFAE